MTNEDHTALLIMDVQPGIIERASDQQQYLDGVRAAVAAAHQHQVPVIFVVVGFRPGFPEISQHNKMFGAVKQTVWDAMVDPQPVTPPAEGDVVVVKRRVSAFSGSDLEVLLRAQGVRHLVLAGIATGGVVLSTVREAADKDFQLTVLSDLCADADPEVQTVLLEKILPRQADVVTSQQWISALNK